MSLRTPLYDWHVAAGARIVEFGGWEMPLQFTSIVEEHLAVRRAVGLFDVSHMGKILVDGESADRGLDYLSANEIPRRPGRARYTHLLRQDGTILDDVIVTCLSPDRYLVVCNAGPRPEILGWIRDHLTEGVRISDVTATVLCLALQGPGAPALLRRLVDVDPASLKPFEGASLGFRPPTPSGPPLPPAPPEVQGWGASIPARGGGGTTGSGGMLPVFVTRTGYTGEPGFELFPPAAWGRWIWESLLAEGSDLAIRPIGLGARDTLRLEKGYLLSGQDFDGRQTPLEVGCEWLVKWDHAFLGRESLAAQKARDVHPRLVGLRMQDRAIPRRGGRVRAEGRAVGTVTSGTLSPSLRVGIALASVDRSHASVGTELDVEVRGIAHPARVVRLPFL